MKKLLTLAFTLVALTWVSCAAASINLNSSRSNIYRVMYQQGVTPAQATAILTELGKSGGSGLNEAMVRQVLRKAGVGGINKIILMPANRASALPTIILMTSTNPADEQAAREIAVSDSGVVSTPKPPIIIKK